MAKQMYAHCKNFEEIAVLFFGHPTDLMVRKNTLHDQILSVNMHAIDLRLFRQILEIRKPEHSQTPSYWANHAVKLQIAHCLIQFRKLTEPHHPKNDGDRYSISFQHLLHELSALPDAYGWSGKISFLQSFVAKEHDKIKHVVDKYLVHAATPESRAINESQKLDVSTTDIWSQVLRLNHVFREVRTLANVQLDDSILEREVRQHLPDLVQSFALTDNEEKEIYKRYSECLNDLSAIYDGTASPRWETSD
jgi:hypothetical protein